MRQEERLVRSLVKHIERIERRMPVLDSGHAFTDDAWRLARKEARALRRIINNRDHELETDAAGAG